MTHQGGELADVPARRTITLTRASSITPRPVRWLWQDRLPLAALGLLGGREAVGKTILAYTLAADITRGILPGAYNGTSRAVIVAATEDSWAHTIVPRLMAAGADLDRVYRVDVVTVEGGDSTLSLPTDLDALGGVVRDVQAVLILLDPLLSRLEATLDTHKDAEVRLALEPLVKLADKINACVLGVIHVNKGASPDVLTQLMASRAFAAVARAVLFVMVDPDDRSVRLLGQAKNNLGRMDLPTLTFRIDGTTVAETDEGPVETAKLVWLSETDRTITDVVEAAAAGPERQTATRGAATWLADHLAKVGEPQDASIILAAGQQAGHSKNALYRARTQLGIISKWLGFPRKAYWSLPPSVVPAPGGGQTTGNTETTDTPVDPVVPLVPVDSPPHDTGTTGEEPDQEWTKV